MPVEAVEPGPNLPTEGRSAFDHLIQRNAGKIPDSREGLIAWVKSQFGNVVGALLPDGRSLARFSTDFRNPRSVFTGVSGVDRSFASPSDLVHRLGSDSVYFGHASKTNSLEVISFNPRMGRYEFQVVRNLGPGLKPVVEYSDRALCMSCHQNGGPIFSVSPWEETESNRKVAQALVDHNPDFTSHGLISSEGMFDSTGRPNSQVRLLDTRVRAGNSLLYLQDFMKRGCGADPVEGPECRRLIAELAFTDWSKSGKDHEKFKAKWSRIDTLLSKFWPKEGIKIDEGDLPNRDPFIQTRNEPLSEYLNPLSLRSPQSFKYGGYGRNRAGNSVSYDQYEVLKEMSKFFRADEVDYLKGLVVGDVEKIHSALENPSMAHFFDGRILDKSEFYRELLKNLGHPVEENLWRLEESKMPPMVLAGQVLQDGSAKLVGHQEGELHLFKKNCASCHTGQTEPRMNFMEAASDEALLQQIRSNPEIARRLSWESIPEAQRMPPQRSRQGQALRGSEAQDRLSMVSFIRQKGCPEVVESLLLKLK